MRSSASAALFGAGAGLASAGAPPATLRRREARSSSSLTRRVAGGHRQRHHRPAQQIGIVLVDFRREHMRAQHPLARRDRHGHVEQRREILPHIKLAVLAADEHRDLSGALRRFRLCAAAFSAPGRRDGSFFASGAMAGVSAIALTGSGRFLGGLRRFSVSASSSFGRVRLERPGSRHVVRLHLGRFGLNRSAASDLASTFVSADFGFVWFRPWPRTILTSVGLSSAVAVSTL